jgi:hypothetical protein
LELGSLRLKIKLISNGFAKSPNRRRAAQIFSPLRPPLAIVLGSGFHHALPELRMAKNCAFTQP